MDFYDILEETILLKGHSEMPNGDLISIDFLNEHFSQYSTVDEMINATESEGLKLYFAWLRDEGILD